MNGFVSTDCGFGVGEPYVDGRPRGGKLWVEGGVLGPEES